MQEMKGMKESGIKAEDFKGFCTESYQGGARIKQANYKSAIMIGNFNVMTTTKFNWFQRLMWKICFNAKAVNFK